MNNESKYFSINNTEQLRLWFVAGDGGNTLLISHSFDTAQSGTGWHRLTMERKAGVKTSVCLYAADTKRVRLKDGTLCDLDRLITNPLLSTEEKGRFLVDADFWSREYDNITDISLHEFNGRYIWLKLKLKGKFALPSIRIYYPRSSFIRYLPESMQTGADSFFARFTAIFQNLYLDLDEKIESFHTNLIPAAASQSALVRLACWLGLEPLLPLDESKLRVLVSEAWELVPAWGTRRALSRVLEILCGDKPFIREHGGCDRFSFTVLLTVDTELHTVRRAIEAMKPAHTSFSLVVLRQSTALNSNVYMGVNSSLTDYAPLRMDSDTTMGIHRLR